MSPGLSRIPAARAFENSSAVGTGCRKVVQMKKPPVGLRQVARSAK